MKKGLIGAVALLLTAGAVFSYNPQGKAEEVTPKKQWVGAWTASHQKPSEEGLQGVSDQTLRLIVHPHLEGKTLRIRLSNSFGWQPVTFRNVYIGVVDEGAALLPRTNKGITFEGKSAVTVEPGKTVTSDALRFKVEKGRDLAVSLYVPEASGPVSWHRMAKQRSYLSVPGNHAARTDPKAFTQPTHSWYWLTGVDVLPQRGAAGGIVTLGDSITNGAGSTSGSNHRYPDLLAKRLREEGIRKSVMNAGISGNKIGRDDSVYGPSALNRLERDVLNQPGVTDVILLEGINDIGHHPHTSDAEHIIAGMKEIINRSREKGLKIYGGTLLPYKGANYYTAKGEATRKKVNQWIRTSGAFDGVIDFEQALQDPADPERLLPAYDSGDHLHPSDAGYQAMAEAINLDLFRPVRKKLD